MTRSLLFLTTSTSVYHIYKFVHFPIDDFFCSQAWFNFSNQIEIFRLEHEKKS